MASSRREREAVASLAESISIDIVSCVVVEEARDIEL